MKTFINALLLVALLASPALALDCESYPHDSVIRVSSTGELDSALRGASAGDLIILESGTYQSVITGGDFRYVGLFNKKGTESKPIVVCGPDATMDATVSGKTPYGFWVENCEHVIVAGLTLKGGQKGLVVDGTSYSTFDSITVTDIGQEGIHLRYGSHHNTVKRCKITNTGRTDEGTGEGIYVGSSSRADNDPSDYNRILYNTIGPGVTADPIDIKENTKGGWIEGNILDGSGLCGCNSATSLINVKGNDYTIVGNKGKNTIEDMFKVAETIGGEGENNHFESNECDMSGAKGGAVCVKIPNGDDTRGNTVACNNDSSGGSETNNGCTGSKVSASYRDENSDPAPSSNPSPSPSPSPSSSPNPSPSPKPSPTPSPKPEELNLSDGQIDVIVEQANQAFDTVAALSVNQGSTLTQQEEQLIAQQAVAALNAATEIANNAIAKEASEALDAAAALSQMSLGRKLRL